MGPPLDDSFRRFFGFNDEQASEAVKIYREYYSETGVLEFTPYDGIKELLISLKNDGRKLFVATSKPVFYANKVLDKCGFSKYFDGIYGSEFDGTRSKKIDVLRYAVVQSGISDLNEGVMIVNTTSSVRKPWDLRVWVYCSGTEAGKSSKPAAPITYLQSLRKYMTALSPENNAE